MVWPGWPRRAVPHGWVEYSVRALITAWPNRTGYALAERTFASFAGTGVQVQCISSVAPSAHRDQLGGSGVFGTNEQAAGRGVQTGYSNTIPLATSAISSFEVPRVKFSSENVHGQIQR